MTVIIGYQQMLFLTFNHPHTNPIATAFPPCALYHKIRLSPIGSRWLTPPDVPQPCRLIVLARLCKFPLVPPGVPTSTTTQEISSRETVGEKWQVILPTNGELHAVEGVFYMSQICDMGPTALPPLQRNACWGSFRPEISDGFDRVRTRVPEASMLPLDHRSRCTLRLRQYWPFWELVTCRFCT
jgi:hypothetical protein